MQRKVIKQGNDTLTITLPRKWTGQYNIKAGDDLEVEVREGSLVLSTEKSAAMQALDISISTPKDFLKRFIDVPYRHGYDEIKVSFDDPKVLPLVQAETENLLGFEVVDQGKRTCVLKNVAQAMESEFDNLLRRIFHLTKTTWEEALSATKTGSFDELENVKNMERINHKLTNFCERVLNKKGYTERHKTTTIFYLVAQLEVIADELRDICVTVRDYKLKMSPELYKLFKEVGILFDAMYQLFYKFDHKKVVAMTAKEKELVRQCLDMIVQKKGAEVLVLHHLLSLVRAIHHVTDFLY